MKYYFDVTRRAAEELDMSGVELATRDTIADLATNLALEVAKETLPDMGNIAVSVRPAGLPIIYWVTLSIQSQWIGA